MHLINAEPPRTRIEAVRIVDMSASNSWAEFAALFRNTRSAFLDHERAKNEKALMPEDVSTVSVNAIFPLRCAWCCIGPAQRSVSGFFLILVANSTSRLIASARDGRSPWPRRQSSTVRKNCSDTRIWNRRS
jgi:hypothetical protein